MSLKKILKESLNKLGLLRKGKVKKTNSGKKGNGKRNK